MIIEQIKSEFLDNFSYLIGCEKTHFAIVVDPGPNIKSILDKSGLHQLHIQYIVNTHGHSDHTSGNTVLKQKTNAKIVMHQADAIQYHDIDIRLVEETVLNVGEIDFQIIHTPGHTPGGICLYTNGNLFTGDTLFVGDSGRTDLSGGDRATLGASIRKLMNLPGNTVVWPGHDYGPVKKSTLAWEQKNNVNAKEYNFYQE